jgi:hypothetical protein
MPAGGELQRAVKDAGERRVQEVVPSQAAPPPDPQDQDAQDKATDPNSDFPEQPIDMAQHKSSGDGPALEVRKAGESEPAGYDTTRGVNRDVGHMLLGLEKESGRHWSDATGHTKI